MTLENEKINYTEMPELEQWVLHRFSELSERIQEHRKV